jgi:tRNA dimethylallyltransferase
MSNPMVLVLLGPTAVGKTALSLELGEALQAEIISADSRLFYRGMDIGTAKPERSIRRRLTHHLIDVSEPNDAWSLERYLQAAAEAIRDIHQRGRLPILVGGTGQYIRALVDGWRPPPRPKDDRMRKAFYQIAEQQGPQALHDKLQKVDPVSAERIDYRNVRRVVRALEVYQLTGEPFSSQRRIKEPDFQFIKIGLIRPREELYARIDQRIEAMLDAGWLDEIQVLLKAGYGLENPALSAIGYQQLIQYLQGELTLEEAVVLIKRLTRQYVRRQSNWFKRDDETIHWFEIRPGIAEPILEFLENEYGLCSRYAGEAP